MEMDIWTEEGRDTPWSQHYHDNDHLHPPTLPLLHPHQSSARQSCHDNHHNHSHSHVASQMENDTLLTPERAKQTLASPHTTAGLMESVTGSSCLSVVLEVLEVVLITQVCRNYSISRPDLTSTVQPRLIFSMLSESCVNKSSKKCLSGHKADSRSI